MHMKKPLATYGLSNTHGVGIYEIRYGIEEEVLVGDSYETAEWQTLKPSPELDTYIIQWGELELPLNEFIRTNIGE